MSPNSNHLEDIRWVITRVDGRIASVSTSWQSLRYVSSYVSSWPESRVDRIVCEKISTEELFRIAGSVDWDDLLPLGTPFQKEVWKTLFEISRRVGEDGTRLGPRLMSYTDLAETCGKPKGVRAVAHAVGRNPIPVIIPCHLVVPKEVTDSIVGIEKAAESTLFGKDGLRLSMSYDFGEYSVPGGKALKKLLIARQFR